VERGHLWQALRYVELNPLRAGMVAEPAQYRWSSAAAHLAGPGAGAAAGPLDWDVWREAGGLTGWRELLRRPVTLNEVVEMRRCTYAGKPLGGPEFVAELESRFGRQWLGKGRPRKEAKSEKGTERSGAVSA
jgi:putative transposase